MMLRQTAVDMENSENLLDGETIVYNSRCNNNRCNDLFKGCCLILSYSFLVGLGFFIGINANSCDGSSSFFYL